MALHTYFHRFIPLELPFSFVFASPVPHTALEDVALLGFLHYFCLDLLCFSIGHYCTAVLIFAYD